MKRLKRVRNGGVPAMNPMPYPSFYEGEKELQASDKPWWQRWVAIILFVLGLSGLDAATLYSVIGSAMAENQYIGKFMVGGLALALNFITLIAGYLIRERYYERSRVPVWALVILSATFLLLFSATFYLHWETGEESGESTALTLLLGALPFVTSVTSVYLGFISEDPIRRRINKLRLRRIELQEMLSDLEAAKCEMERERTEQLMAALCVKLFKK